MAEKPQAQFDFLRSYIEQLLDKHGFETLSEETRAQYVPQFVAEAERRLGIALMPHLDESAAKEFESLLTNEDMTTDQLQSFWQTHVPNFESIVKETLENFAKEFAAIIK